MLRWFLPYNIGGGAYFMKKILVSVLLSAVILSTNMVFAGSVMVSAPESEAAKFTKGEKVSLSIMLKRPVPVKKDGKPAAAGTMETITLPLAQGVEVLNVLQRAIVLDVCPVPVESIGLKDTQGMLQLVVRGKSGTIIQLWEASRFKASFTR